MPEAEKNNIAYPKDLVISPVTIDPTNTPTPVTALFTPKYFPSNPCGMLLKNITDVEVLKIENAITIKQADAIVTGKPRLPTTKIDETAGIITATIRGMQANIVDLCSPNLEIILGTIKKTTNIVAVWIM